MTINPIHVHGGQRACDDKSHTRALWAGYAGSLHDIITAIYTRCNVHLLLQTVPSVLVEWPPNEVGVRADNKRV